MTKQANVSSAGRVHIRDLDGNLLYTGLYDDGGPVLNFDGVFGFVDRLDVQRYRWQVLPGWPETGTELDCDAESCEYPQCGCEPQMKDTDRIQTRRDDEHGLKRPWIALIDGDVLRDRRGYVRTFGTQKAARAAAERVARKAK